MARSAGTLPKDAKGRRRRAGPVLVATALGRSIMKRRVRALSAVVAGIAGVALTTAVLVVSYSVLDAIQGSRLNVLSDAEWAVVARSSSGMEPAVLDRIRGAAPGAVVASNVVADTRVGGSGDPIVVVGADEQLRQLANPSVRERLGALPPLTGHDVYLTREWAGDHGLQEGESVQLESPTGTAPWRVRALLDEDLGNHGAVAVAPLPAVDAAFMRGGAVDVAFVDGPEPAAELRERLQRAAGGAALVVAPDETAESYERSFASVRNLLNLLTLIVVLVAGAVIFFAWRLTIEEERPNLARLRLIGSNRFDILAAAAMLVAPAIAISMLFGFPLGLALGALLTGFTRRLVELTQLAAEPGLPVVRPLVGAFLNAQLIIGVATIAAVVPLVRMTVIEGISMRSQTRARAGTATLAVASAALLAAGVLSLLLLPERARWVGLLPLVLLIPVVSRVVPKLLGAAILTAKSWLALITGRDLAHGARRSAAFVGVLALALALSLALEAIARSLEDDVDDSVAAWTKADVFVQTAESGSNLADDKLVPEADRVLADAPGVDATAYFTYSTVELGGRRTPLWTWESTTPDVDIGRFVDLDVEEGPGGEGLWRSLEGGGVAVSSNYAYLHRLGLGDRVTVPTRDGTRQLQVTTIFKDLASDGGVLVLAPSVYREVTGDVRRYQLLADLEPGASVDATRDALRAELGRRHPQLVVWDRTEIREHFHELNGQLLQTFKIFARVLFVLALLVGATAIAAGLAARRRAFALERLVGTPRSTLRRQVLAEHVMLGVCAWLIGFPVGFLLAPALLRALALDTGMVPELSLPWALAIIALPLTIAVAGLAFALAAGKRGEDTSISGALADE
jgi:putative ABC transport system permease protein